MKSVHIAKAGRHLGGAIWHCGGLDKLKGIAWTFLPGFSHGIKNMEGKIASFAFFSWMLLWASPAMAYIDPGSGSAIMSALIGLFVAVGISFKSYWYKIKSLFLKRKTMPEEAEAAKDGENSCKE